jgi:hypothetical protein
MCNCSRGWLWGPDQDPKANRVSNYVNPADEEPGVPTLGRTKIVQCSGYTKVR